MPRTPHDTATLPPSGQKWRIGLLLAFLLGALAPMLVRNFVPAPHWQEKALYITLGLLVVGSLWMRRLYRQGQPKGPWVAYGPLKRALMLGFMGLFLWLNVAVTAPLAWTTVMGQAAQQTSMVRAERRGGRHSCPYQFKVRDIGFLFFQFCIDKEDYLARRNTPLPAVLQLRQSYFGKQVTGLRLTLPSKDAAEAEAVQE